MAQTNLSRRRFLGTAAAGSFAFTFVPSTAFGANDRINVGCIGVGGKGATDMNGAASAGGQVVALCDVDDNRKRKEATDDFKDARFYRDFREMLESEGDKIDAVTVSTPDHVHCHASVMAMRKGKHIYCQKPLTRTIAEARLMTETAEKYGVATQMGNQAHAGEPIRRAVEYIRAGVIGKVNEVHCWTNRPIWPQGMQVRPEPQPVPKGLDWDLWLGPVYEVAYSDAYVPFNWRGWWDFGTGALGDMGCHIMDMPYWALDLKYPTSVEATSDGNTALAGPTASTVTYEFAAGQYNNDLAFSWYDGDRLPSDEVIAGSSVRPDRFAKAFDMVLIGDKGKMFFKRTSTKWEIVGDAAISDSEKPPMTIPRVEGPYSEWIAACKGGSPALSNFSSSGPFSEQVLLGNLAIRLAKRIEWNGAKMKATNAPEADALIHPKYREGWQL